MPLAPEAAFPPKTFLFAVFRRARLYGIDDLVAVFETRQSAAAFIAERAKEITDLTKGCYEIEKLFLSDDEGKFIAGRDHPRFDPKKCYGGVMWSSARMALRNGIER